MTESLGTAVRETEALGQLVVPPANARCYRVCRSDRRNTHIWPWLFALQFDSSLAAQDAQLPWTAMAGPAEQDMP